MPIPTETKLSCRSPRKPGQRGLGKTAKAIRAAVIDLTGSYERMTVRQVFYKLETQGVVEKTEAGYGKVQRQVKLMREEGLLDWSFIADGTRLMRKPSSWSDADSFLYNVARSYRRDLWQGHDARIEVWLEKDALGDIVSDATYKWDVPLMVSRGQSSVTFLHGAAMAAQDAWEHEGATTYIYALYDDDAGGHTAAEAVERKLPEYAPGVPIVFERLAVTQAQIAQWNLPTRPAKKSDPRAAKFGATAVELDAIDPDQLKKLVENAILRHVDRHAWSLQESFEAEERDRLERLADAFSGAPS